jgi:chromosome segregation ATPase
MAGNGCLLLRLVEEMLVGVKGFDNTSSGEDRLIKDIYQLLVELGKVDEADGLVELVGRLDKQVTAFEDMLEDRDIRIDDLEDEIERKVDRIDFLENELVEVRGALELRRVWDEL